MKKLAKRLLALALGLLMAVPMLPGAAFAVDGDETAEAAVTTEAAAPVEEEAESVPTEEPSDEPALPLDAEPVASGTCGDNLTWTLDSDGLLTISGTGDMENYSTGDAPWYGYREQIAAVEIEDGLTSIGSYAFYNCSGLTSVVIPASVTNIGDGDLVFYRCSSLTEIVVAENNPNYTSVDGILYDKNIETLLECPGGKSGSVIIPGTVTSIEALAFWDCSLTDVTIPGSVTNIGWDAFRNCSSLIQITFEGDAPTFGTDVFRSVTATAYYPAGNETWTEDVMQDYGGTITWVASVEVIASGECGDNLTWTLDANGLLTISGTGDMYDYSYGGSPWYEFKDQIAAVVMEDGATSIGSSAFCDCTSLTSVVIPDGVTSIGTEAFEYCSSLTEITLPAGLTSIGDCAFQDCSRLTSVVIPDGVTSIGANAFYYCNSLTSVTLPTGLTSIGGAAFCYCSSLTEIVIPENVTSISNYAFTGCSSLTEITFKGDAPTIGSSAFSSVTATAYYPKGNETWTYNVMQNYGGTITWVASVEGIASGECGDNLTWTLDNAGTLTISGAGVMSSFAFEGAPWYDCHEEIQSVVIEEGAVNVSRNAFCNCTNLADVALPDSVTSIGGLAFSDCSSLTSITLPDSLTDIGDYAFSGCSGLTEIVIPDSVTGLGYSAFSDCSSLTSVTIGSGLTSIGASAFSNCSSLTSVTIGSGLTSIGASAFSNCSGLTSITLPDSVTSIGEYAFDHCSNLTSITLPNGITEIAYSVFSGCSSLTSVVIPENVTSIGDYAFDSCSSLTEIVIPENVTGIGEYAFDSCSSLTGVTIGSGVTSIGRDAFSGCSSLTAIVIPESVTGIDHNLFYNCSSLMSVTIGSGVTSIGADAFSNCSSLAAIVIPESVTGIGYFAFYNCSGLKKITFEGNAPVFGDRVFYDVTATAYYPAGNETWTEAVMQNYGGTITWEASVEVIASGECGDNLTWTLDANGLLTISGTGDMYDFVLDYNHNGSPWYQFREQIVAVVIEEGVTGIGNTAFYGCSSLTSIAIPEGVTSIGDYAFKYCSSLTSVTIPDSVTSIGSDAFSGCSGLADEQGFVILQNILFHYSGTAKEVVIPEGVKRIDSAFANCFNVTSITIPGSVTSIGDYAFTGCSGLTSITIPEGVTSIGGYAFNDCRSLTEITLPSGLTSIGNEAFCGCHSLTSVMIPDSVTSIGSGAFYGCDSLTSVTIPNSVTSIGSSAFYRCIGLTEITFKGDAPTFGTYVFQSVTATAYYPEGNETWTYNVMQNYGGTITWVAYSDGPVITAQPEDFTGATGQKATFTVEVEGNGLTYQWQYCNAGKTKWANSSQTGAKTATLTVPITAARDGQMYRCVIKDEYGNTVTSDAATLHVIAPPKILTQPSDFTGAVGQKATFSVVAEGEGLTYQWQYLNVGTTKWKNSSQTGSKTAALTVPITTARYGQQYRCVITDENGSTVTSDAAALLEPVVNLKITTQPNDFTGPVGQKATFTVEAEGDGLTYQWQYLNVGTTKWKDSSQTGSKTATLTISITAARDGQQYRCVIKDEYGNTVTSDAATLHVAEPPRILTQPVDFTGSVGQKATFTVEAEGDGLTYQWQYLNVGTTKWKNSTQASATTAVLSISITAARDGQQYRCVIKDEYGNTVTSDAATLYVGAAEGSVN